MTLEVLNLYAGLGGNRKLWEDVNVTAVEINPKVARFYAAEFPDDEVVVADAHTFLEDHHSDGWDFIWSSVPCQTHTKIKPMTWASDAPQNASREPEYPDMRLYQEVILLDYFAECDWVVENVVSYYQPLVEPQKVGRHYIWSNRQIPPLDLKDVDAWKNPPIEVFEERYGFDLSDADLGMRKDQAIRNCVDPELGKHVLDAVRDADDAHEQATLPGTEDVPAPPVDLTD